MTLPKKGIRKLSFNGVQYGWLVRSKPTWNQGHQSPMTLAIQALDCETPTVLHVTLNIDRPDNWFKEHNIPIVPSAVKNMIELAIDDGWVPDAGGSAYEFKFVYIDKSQPWI